MLQNVFLEVCKSLQSNGEHTQNTPTVVVPSTMGLILYSFVSSRCEGAERCSSMDLLDYMSGVKEQRDIALLVC